MCKAHRTWGIVDSKCLDIKNVSKILQPRLYVPASPFRLKYTLDAST